MQLKQPPFVPKHHVLQSLGGFAGQKGGYGLAAKPSGL